MALSLGSRRRRLPCRTARGGGKGGEGCRHFHVHYHFPRQVRAFSSLRLPSSLLSLWPYLLIPPVLFFAVLAFLVCFGWFTLVYFVSSLWRKCNSHECLESEDCANELCRNEEQARKKEESAGDSAAEPGTGCSAMAAACIDGQDIKEVFVVDGFSDASLDMSRMASPYDCTMDEEHSSCEKIVEEVTVFETDCKEFSEVSYLDDSSEKQQLQETPVDWFVEKIGSSKSCGTANLVHLQSGQEFVVNRKEAPAYASSETLELIDKHETRAVVVICSENSAENNVKCGADLSDDIFANKLPDDIFDEQQDAENMISTMERGDHTNKKPEDHFIIEEKGNKVFGISDETRDLNIETEMSGLLLDSVCDVKYSTVATSSASFLHTTSFETDRHDNREEAAGSTSVVSHLAENNQAVREEVGVPSTEDSIHEVAFEDSLVIGRSEDADENSGTSEGGPHRLPLIRRSQPPWWNLCGVLDVFGGCKD